MSSKTIASKSNHRDMCKESSLNKTRKTNTGVNTGVRQEDTKNTDCAAGGARANSDNQTSTCEHVHLCAIIRARTRQQKTAKQQHHCINGDCNMKECGHRMLTEATQKTKQDRFAPWCREKVQKQSCGDSNNKWL